MQIPRPEYPRPQFVREHWMNLNGQWQFQIDNGNSGEARGLQNPGTKLTDTIMVPFCPESKLSGIEDKNFMYGVWYKRTVTLGKQAGRTRLHFGAVDYYCKAYVNGVWSESIRVDMFPSLLISPTHCVKEKMRSQYMLRTIHATD